MNNDLPYNQRILVSALLKNKQGEALVVRSVCMQDQINDTEYFHLPSWNISFGIDPKEKIKNELSTLLEDAVTIEGIISTQSYLQDGGATHVIEMVFKASTSKQACKCAETEPKMRFVSPADADAYIFSSRIKKIIRGEV